MIPKYCKHPNDDPCFNTGMTVASDHFDWKARKREITIHDILNVMRDLQHFLWM